LQKTSYKEWTLVSTIGIATNVMFLELRVKVKRINLRLG